MRYLLAVAAAALFILTTVVFTVVTALPAHADGTPLRLRALHWAEAQAGSSYVFGGTGPGFDCSGLVMRAYQHAGVSLPRTTFAMLASAKLRWIPAGQRERGDLAFYGPGHVELVTARGTFGAEAPGTVVGWHHPSAGWFPTQYFRVTG